MIDMTSQLPFNSDKAFNYLVQNGKVYTLRTKTNHSGLKVITRNGEKQFHADVTFEATIDAVYSTLSKKFAYASNLDYYVKQSGFDSVQEWLSECKNKFHEDFSQIRFLYLYLVVKKT